MLCINGGISNQLRAFFCHRKHPLNRPSAEMEQGYLRAPLLHLANIAYAKGRILTFEPTTQRF